MAAHARAVQARPYASSGRLHPLRPSVDNAVLAETGRSWNGFGLAFRFVGWIEGGIEDLGPTSQLLVTTNRRHQEVACPCCGNVGKPH
jgi:hypothetical protein